MREKSGIALPEPVQGLIKGLLPRQLVSFYGPPGSGKTNLCLLAAVSCVRGGGKVLYMDTEGGFNRERLRQITNSWQTVMDNTILVEPRNFREQSALIGELDRHRADLFIVDSMVTLYRLEYAEKDGGKVRPGGPSKSVLEANRELSRQLSLLSALARGKEVPVLVTAHTFKHWDTGLNEIVGGDAIKYWSKVIVYIEKTGRISERKATLIKHTHLPEWGSVKFNIINEGIKPAGFKIF
jgi:DNA repair protein RadB